MCGIWAIFGSDGDIGSYCKYAYTIKYRGPDAFRFEKVTGFPNSCYGFHRHLVNDSAHDMQPLRIRQYPAISVMCNGEVYNYKELGKEFGLSYDTASDIEPIIHLYAKGGIEFAARHIDGSFAFCLVDTANRKVFLCQDTFGVKPVLRIATDTGLLAVCSEAKGLVGLPHDEGYDKVSSQIVVVPPGHIETYTIDKSGKAYFTERKQFYKIGDIPAHRSFPVTEGKNFKENIRNHLTMAVKKRLVGHGIGCYLSGGLASSLVAALTVKLAKEVGIHYQIQTFTVGIEGSPVFAAARKVADFLDTDHHEIVFTAEQSFDVLENVIYHLESCDVSLVRASVAMYIASLYIKKHTDVLMVLSGELDDKIAQGYKYFKRAPSSGNVSEWNQSIYNDTHICDTMTTAVGTGMRLPFSDPTFTSYHLRVSDNLKMLNDGKDDCLLRSAFVDQGLLPDDILLRTELKFGHGMDSVNVQWSDIIHSHLDKKIKDDELKDAAKVYPYNTPTTKEGLHYRRLFEKYYPGMEILVPYSSAPKWNQPSDDCSWTVKSHL